jgi:hypothetical protein
MPRKISYETFVFKRFSIKMSFSMCFDDNLSLTHVFIKQIFRAPEEAPPLAPPLPPPTGLCRRWGRSESLNPPAAALVISMKQLGLGLNMNQMFIFKAKNSRAQFPFCLRMFEVDVIFK